MMPANYPASSERAPRATIKFEESEFAKELWGFFLGYGSNIFAQETGYHRLKLSSQYTLVSQRYNDTYIQGYLRIVSRAYKMFSRLSSLASTTKLNQSRVYVDPLPLVPLRKAIQRFYKTMVDRIDSYYRVEMTFDQLELHFNDFLQQVQCVYELYYPLIKAKDLDKSQFEFSSASLNAETSIVRYKEEIEQTWRKYFYKLLACPDSLESKSDTWKWIFDGLVEVLPNYLDKIAEYADVHIDDEDDKIILLQKTSPSPSDSKRDLSSKLTSSGLRTSSTSTSGGMREDTAYFRNLWSDRLVSLVKRAFMDRDRLYGRQKNPTTIPKSCSAFFHHCFANFKKDNPTLTNLIDIGPTGLIALLETTFLQYADQYSKLILRELKYKDRLLQRLEELTAIYKFQAFAEQFTVLQLDENSAYDRSTVFHAAKRALTSPLLPETTSKYWGVTIDDGAPKEDQSQCCFKIVSNASWPVNLMITKEFLENLAPSLNLLHRVYHFYCVYRTVNICQRYSNGDRLSVRFTRKIQHFIIVFRQVLYRLFGCLTRKINADFQVLLDFVREAQNFNDLESKMSEWQEHMHFFTDVSHTARAINRLCMCAQSFLGICESIKEETLKPEAELERCAEIDEFMLGCEDLLSPNLSVCELTPFEQELFTIVAHITYEKLQQ